MGKNLYPVRLSQTEREHLQQLIRSGKRPARETARVRILLKTDEEWSAPAEEGLEWAIKEKPRPRRPRKLDERGEAHLIALACSPAPEGHDHWTLRLLAGKVVELGLAPSMSHEGIRKRLKKTRSSRGRSRSGAFPR